MAWFKGRQQHADGKYMSDHEKHLQALQAKRGEAVEQVEQRRRELEDAAVEAALSPDPWVIQPRRQALQDAEAHVQVIDIAIAQVEQAERARQAQVEAEKQRARNNSIRQKIALELKEVRACQAGIAQVVRSFRRAAELASDIQKLAPYGSGLHYVMQPGILREAFQTEMNRVGAAMPTTLEVGVPGTSWPIGFNRSTEPPMADALEARFMAAFNQLNGKATPPAKPKDDPPPITAAPEPSPKPAPLSAHEWVNLNRKQAAADPPRDERSIFDIDMAGVTDG